jgi:hypothetical protein
MFDFAQILTGKILVERKIPFANGQQVLRAGGRPILFAGFAIRSPASGYIRVAAPQLYHCQFIKDRSIWSVRLNRRGDLSAAGLT